MESTDLVEVHASKLEKLGMIVAAQGLRTKVALGKKLTQAYEHYRFVEPGIVEKFNEALKKKTFQEGNHAR